MISLVGTLSHTATANGADATMTMPAGIRVGDVAVVFGGHPHRAGAPLGPSTAGYTEITTHTAAAPNVGAWYKLMGSSPDADVIVLGSTNANDGTAYIGFVLRSVDPDTILDVVATTAGPTTSADPDPPAITPVTDGTCLIVFAGSTIADTTITEPAGTTNPVTVASIDAVSMTAAGALLLNQTNGSPINVASWTNWASAANYTITVALRPANVSYLLAESGDRLITEDGDALILEEYEAVAPGSGAHEAYHYRNRGHR